MTRTLRFTKGHGTRNDFVLLDDRGGEFALTATMAAALADRRSGIGGDGVIRVGPTASASDAEVAAQAGEAPWFMDYRNADGSHAQMCGNGARVFAAYLVREGLVAGPEFAIATRAGVKRVRAGPMYEEGKGSTWDPQVGMEFYQKCVAAGIDLRARPISHVNSVTDVFRALIDLPPDVRVTHASIEARHP